jgi:polyisoprenoid-binding protein YceI
MPVPQLGRYGIDPAHSAVTFRTRHLFGLAPVRGSFAIRSGTVDVTEPVSASGIHAEVDAGWFAARATTRIDRTEFGVTAQRGMAGRYLDLTVEARCARS